MNYDSKFFSRKPIVPRFIEILLNLHRGNGDTQSFYKGLGFVTTGFLILALFSFAFFSKSVQADETQTGRRIMDEVFKRHHLFPYVFEAQTMILIDRAGNRDVRKLRRFSRVEEDGTVKYLLIFDNPAEVRGVALLAIRQSSGHKESGIYLPAFGKKLISNSGDSKGSHFLGTDFALQDLTAEVLSDFRYARGADREIDKIVYFVVDAFPRDEEIERSTGYSLRRHFIGQDNFFIIRTDFFDRRGRFSKRQTHHDLKREDGEMWRANMILMEDLKENHKTLIKINRRVFSHDYVPSKMFTSAWLLENRHVQDTEKRLFQDALKSSEEDNDLVPDDPQGGIGEGRKQDFRSGRKQDFRLGREKDFPKGWLCSDCL